MIHRKSASSVGLARVPRERRLRVGGHSSHVVPRSCNERERPRAGAVPFRIASITFNPAQSARVSKSRISPPPETQPAQWRLRVGHANAGCALEFTARTSHHGLEPKKRGLLSVQVIGHRGSLDYLGSGVNSNVSPVFLLKG